MDTRNTIGYKSVSIDRVIRLEMLGDNEMEMETFEGDVTIHHGVVNNIMRDRNKQGTFTVMFNP